jgi:hypothetical protein
MSKPILKISTDSQSSAIMWEEFPPNSNPTCLKNNLQTTSVLKFIFKIFSNKYVLFNGKDISKNSR